MGLRTDIGLQSAATRGSTDTYADNLETEVLIVGAGFGGVYLLHKLRDELGLNCKVYEAGKDLGGVWHWNCYPGARVDTSVPLYEFSFERVWKDWTWKEKYPTYRELRQYFDHVDKQLDIKKDVAFDTRVVAAEFDKETCKWVVKTEDGRIARCTYFLLATGFAAKRHFPDWKGLDTFNGVMHHSSFWPEEGVEIKGKRVAVIGTGATGVQLTQECAKDAAELTVFQRTPNLALPMRQRTLTKEEQDAAKDQYAQIYKHRLSTFGGFSSDRSGKMTFDDTPQQRQAFFEKPWENGGFEFWLANYDDMLLDATANREAYDFWAKKTRSRLHDPVKKDILAPLEAPHPFGTKRPSLEQDYYEQFNKPNVHVVDVKQNPIVEVTPTGIVTADGKLHEVDVIALATGFDSLTGGMKNMGLKDADGVDLSEKWKTGTWSYLGMTCHGYPNMFFLYGAQGPTAFSNGPSCVEIQADWIVDTIAALRKENIKTIEATKDAEEEWRQIVTALSDATLFPGTSSWYMGANVPGKPREQLNYLGGLPRYGQECRERLDGWKGFTVVR
ncbi:hypothetical protein MMC32_004085 [Xylographa parallela]|nr:hypothetical protein [Xylographa parallela]